MKGVVIILLLLLSSAFTVGFPKKNRMILPKLKKTSSDPYSVKYFAQTLDHFDFTNNQMFQQKYLISGL